MIRRPTGRARGSAGASWVGASRAPRSRTRGRERPLHERGHHPHCGPVPRPDGGTVLWSLDHSRVTFKCKGGMLLRGSRVRICRRTGKWSGRDTFCLPRDVARTRPQTPTPPRPATTPAPASGRFALRGGRQAATCGSAPRVFHGSAKVVPAEAESGSAEVTFTCKPGLQMIGSARLHCGRDGKWHPAPPFCTHVVVCRSLRCKMQQSGAVTVSLALGHHKSHNHNYDKGLAHRCSWDSAAKSCICVCWREQTAAPTPMPSPAPTPMVMTSNGLTTVSGGWWAHQKP